MTASARKSRLDDPYARIRQLSPGMVMPAPTNAVEEWVDDLRWYRQANHGSKWRWYGEHVMDAVLTYTNGRLTFDTVSDLRKIQNSIERCWEDLEQTRRAVGRALRATAPLGWSWEQIGPEIGLTRSECSRADHSLTMQAFRGQPDNPDESVHVRRVRKIVRRQPWRNPLIEALELVQVMRFFEAVEGMLDDVRCDLIVELRQTRPDSVLLEIVGGFSSASLDGSVEFARLARGGPGDPRRIPRQVLLRD